MIIMKKLFILPLIALVGLTLAGCTTPTMDVDTDVTTSGDVVVYDANSWKDTIADSCQSFNDGCNQCMKGENGEVACTKMYCETYAEAFCTDEEEVALTSGQEYVGLSVEAAQKLAEENNTDFRVVIIDGEGQPVTMDYRIGRINATTDNGVVTSVQVEGAAQAELEGATTLEIN